MIAKDRVRIHVLQRGNHFVGKAVFVYAVAEAKKRVDSTHDFERPIQSFNVAMQIGNDAKFQGKGAFFVSTAPKPYLVTSGKPSFRRTSLMICRTRSG